jgi:glycosyltransferase involved in cell wall biosynthesis
MPDARRAPVAIVHDYLTQRGGAERVVLALHRAFPDAPLYTSLYEPLGTFPEFASLDVRTSVLDRSKVLRRSHRLALPLLAPTFSSMSVDADVAICSSSGWAHGARAAGRKIVYCYAPARWLYQTDEYLATSSRLTRAGFGPVRALLVRWDQHAARSADRYLAISTRSRDLIREAYRIEAEILSPPCTIDVDGRSSSIPELDPGYFLCVSRLMAYKNVAAVLEAFSGLPSERLVVVGRGPEGNALRAAATPNVRLLPGVTDDELRWLYAHARALVAPSYEDFGLTPVEAAAFGTPTIALRFGGYLDTVVEGTTGLFFDEPEPAAIRCAVARLSTTDLDPGAIQRHAGKFGERAFRVRLQELVESLR